MTMLLLLLTTRVVHVLYTSTCLIGLFLAGNILHCSAFTTATNNVTRSVLPVLVTKEYCNMESFNATCPRSNDVLLIRRARYGRMQLGRCVQRNLGYIGCSADVLNVLDSRCSARRKCEFTIPDPELYTTQPCPADTTPYLEVTHECLTVVGDESCTATHATVLNNPFGYIQTSRDVYDGVSGACRWLIQASPGQRVNLTLFYFGRSVTSIHSSAAQVVSKSDLTWNNEVCYDLATVTESARNIIRRLTTCGNGPAINGRERPLYESATHSIDIHLAGNTAARQKLGKFLIKYEVISCADMPDPRDGRAKRDGDTVVVTCNHSNEVWYLTCKGVVWIGKYGNCSHASSASANIQKTGVDAFPYGILIVVAVGVALGVLLGGLLLIFVVLYMRRRHRRPCELDSLPGTHLTSSTPTRMLTTTSPGRHFHPVCPPHLHVDKYSTAVPGGMIPGGMPSGCWFESTLRSTATSGVTGSTISGGGQVGCLPVAVTCSSGGGGQVSWDQTVKYLPEDDDLLTTPDMYCSDKTWTRVVNGDVVNL